MLKSESIAKDLVALPRQPDNLPWPSGSWPTADPVPADQRLFDQLTHAIFDLTEAQGVTYALLIIKEGRIIYERYQHGADKYYLQYSWSMAKSFTHDLVGILVREGKLDIYKPADVEDMVYMVWKNLDRDDDRWLYLPALKNPQRLLFYCKSKFFIRSGLGTRLYSAGRFFWRHLPQNR